MKDPISNLIIQLKNASAANKASIVFPYSNFTFAVVSKLAEKGFVKEPVTKNKKSEKTLEVALVYGKDGKARISGVKRFSKPSKRIYKGADKIFKVKQGYGSTIISTPKGVLTDDEARKHKVGGEVLFSIW